MTLIDGAGTISPEQLKRNQLYMQHPDTSPEQFVPGDYLLDPPGRLSATASWINFRRELADLMAARPDDPNFPRYAAQAEKVLAWRATIPAEDRFWRPDTATPGGVA